MQASEAAKHIRLFLGMTRLLIKIFTLKFSEAAEGFDDEKIRAFMAGNTIICVRERFFIRDDTPYWTVMLIYKPLTEPSIIKKDSKSGKERTGGKEDYRALLSEKTIPIYNLLREWRNTRATKEGLPPYILFTNDQLARIASKLPDSLNQLAAVEGVGSAKLEKYGKDVIAIIQKVKDIGKDEASGQVTSALCG